jgi:hypothetical protein
MQYFILERTMGVKDLKKMKNTKGIPLNSREFEISLDSLGDMGINTLYIDASITFKSTKTVYSEYNEENKYTGHFGVIYSYYSNIVKPFNIKIVWVFDPPKNPELKKDTEIKRALVADRPHLRDVDFGQTYEFIRALGMGIVRCKDIEAEHCASLFAKRESNSYVVSTDTDVSMYGANSMQIKISKRSVKILRYTDIVEHFDGISRDSFVKLCCLLGNDYCARTRGFGPAKINRFDAMDLDSSQLTAFNYIIDHDDDPLCNIDEEEYDCNRALNVLREIGISSNNNAYKHLLEESNLLEMIN